MSAISRLLGELGRSLESLPDTSGPGPYRADPGAPDGERSTLATRRYRLRLLGGEPERAGAQGVDRVRFALLLEVPYPLAAMPQRAAEEFDREVLRLRRLVEDPILHSDPRLRLLALTDSRIEPGGGVWLTFTHRLAALVDQTEHHGEEA